MTNNKMSWKLSLKMLENGLEGKKMNLAVNSVTWRK